MKTHREADGRLVVALERGDPFKDSVLEVAREHGLESARIFAIGALEDPEVGYYHLDRKEYAREVLSGIWELVSFMGNISLKDGEPFMHGHAALGGPDYQLRGGHLFDAKVAVVVEMFIDPLPTPLPREHNEEIGLPRWRPGG